MQIMKCFLFRQNGRHAPRVTKLNLGIHSMVKYIYSEILHIPALYTAEDGIL